MMIRVDHRTPLPNYNSVHSIPIVKSYKYLGIEIDDTVTFKPAEKELRKSLNLFKTKLSMQWAWRLPLTMRFTAWSSLITSRFNYGLTCVAIHSEKMAAA